MAKTVTIDQLVYALDGPKKRVPTYQFPKRTFKEYEKPPGQHVRNNEPTNG